MVDINELLGIKSEPEATPEAAPEVKPVTAPAATPLVTAPVAAPVAVKAGNDDFEVLPGIWSVSLGVTHAFTLPDGTWVRPTQDGNGTRAAVPAKWVEYVKAL
jgi:hypothetical protein